MPHQLRLPLTVLEVGVDASGLSCSSGYPWAGHFEAGALCPGCETSLDRSRAEFDAAVRRGDYDENGYTPAEAKAARQHGTYRAWNTSFQERNR